MISVVICDATTNGINLYKQLLHSCPNITIAAIARSSDGLLELLETGIDASIVVLDINLPFTNSLALIYTIHKQYPEYKILVNSIVNDPEILILLLSAGVAGFLCKKEIVPMQLEEAITNIELEGFYYPSECKELFKEIKRPYPFKLPDKGLYSITKKEEVVLKMLATNKTNKEIASILGLSKKTIDAHCVKLYQRLGVTTKTGATEKGNYMHT